MLKPAVVLPFERYTLQRKAEFLLNNAIGADEYRWAAAEVRRMGLDPDGIPHEQPSS